MRDFFEILTSVALKSSCSSLSQIMRIIYWLLCSKPWPMWWQKWDGLGEVVTRMRTTRIFVDGILNAVIYMDTNLTAEFVNFMHQNGPDFTFQKNNASPYTALTLLLSSSGTLMLCHDRQFHMIWIPYNTTGTNWTTVSDADQH